MFRPNLRGLLVLALSLTSTPLLAADPAPLADDTAKQSYALGFQIGRDVRGVKLDTAAVVRGLQDGSSGAKPQMSQEELVAALQKLQQQAQAEQQKRQTEELAKTAAAGKAYLEVNAKQQGVVTTPSGLQYRVITPGTGKTPTATDTVTVNYRGTLVDGAEFDSSYSRGQPATFPLNGVVAGWTEGLQHVQEGGKIELVIPPSLAYGDKGPLANQVLVLEVELIKIGAPEAGK
ncbi:MAG: FKBP-type peptidyl-prolyl cis-trans isomerase N-terminal domain-containing protein [Steroidobacteraceae bacterium]